MSNAATEEVEAVEAMSTTMDTEAAKTTPIDEGAEVVPLEANVELADTPFEEAVS